MRIGYGLSCEEYGPADLIRQARLAEKAGFTALWISDHYHPWNNAQGQSPFVWSVIGAVSQVTDLPITTAVTCPTLRIHPAVIAQAAATSAVMNRGRFTLGVGSGEALNEHIFGDAWPTAPRRLEMLEEAVDVMRALWSGDVVNHDGEYYTVEHARLYTVPDEPVPVYVSGFGPRATDLAARVGDGYISVKPDKDSVDRFRAGEGKDKPAWAGAKACYAATEHQARGIAHRLWANEGLPGELAQVLPTPEHFEQASELVTPDMVKMACGPDPEVHRAMVDTYRDAGYDTLFVAPVGPHDEQMIDLYCKEIIPSLAG
ncbi:MAG TPA: TIGR03557 family F420-dependent LLM class oxidoreductase [Rugosimonospora sp.]|jgi:G6PDH family F420-dependent oxidoreductase